MLIQRRFDVLIVGMGPAGIAASCAAAESGLRVGVVDVKNRGPSLSLAKRTIGRVCHEEVALLSLVSMRSPGRVLICLKFARILPVGDFPIGGRLSDRIPASIFVCIRQQL